MCEVIISRGGDVEIKLPGAVQLGKINRKLLGQLHEVSRSRVASECRQERPRKKRFRLIGEKEGGGEQGDGDILFFGLNQ